MNFESQSIILIDIDLCRFHGSVPKIVLWHPNPTPFSPRNTQYDTLCHRYVLKLFPWGTRVLALSLARAPRSALVANVLALDMDKMLNVSKFWFSGQLYERRRQY